MKVTLLLADSAQAVEGKLYVLGGGWSLTGPAPTPSALAIKIEVPWSEANRQHQWRATLEDADGQPVLIPGLDQEGNRVEVGGSFEVGRPPGLVEGTALDLPMAVNLGPLPLTPGARYQWRFSIDDHTEDGWSVSFSVRQNISSQPAGA